MSPKGCHGVETQFRSCTGNNYHINFVSQRHLVTLPNDEKIYRCFFFLFKVQVKLKLAHIQEYLLLLNDSCHYASSTSEVDC